MSDELKRPVETSEVKRRRLRGMLRKDRESADLTQKAAADALFWSTSKIIRIEQGTVPVVPTDVRALVNLYGVTDQERIDTMIDLSRGSRDQEWSAYRDVYSAAALSLFGNEPSANVIYKYEPTYVPGLFQTRAYAGALLKALGFSEAEIQHKIEARLDRQQLLDAPVHPELHFILGEAVISRPVGGREVMLEQLRYLKELGQRTGVTIQVLPFAAGPHRGMGDAFTILQFDDPEVSDLLYLEDAGQESAAVESPKLIKRYLDIFVDLQDLAPKPEELAETVDGISKQRFGAAPGQ